MTLSKDDILKALAEMSVMELVELVHAIEEKFGVTAAAPAAVAVAGAPAADAAGEAAAADEKTEYDLELTAAGDKKVGVIKAVRAITGLGLKESKEIVDKAPSVVKETMPKGEAEEARKQLEEAGATATLK